MTRSWWTDARRLLRQPELRAYPHPGRVCGRVEIIRRDGAFRDEVWVCDCAAEKDPEWKDYAKWRASPQCDECWNRTDQLEEVDEFDCHDNKIGTRKLCPDCRRGDG